MKLNEEKRLAKERRVLEQQSRALLKLPTKKERRAVEALEMLLEKERADGRAAAARHKLTLERLRTQVKELQVSGVDSSCWCGSTHCIDPPLHLQPGMWWSMLL